MCSCGMWLIEALLSIVYLLAIVVSVVVAARGRPRLGLKISRWYLIIWSVWCLVRMSYQIPEGRITSAVASAAVLIANAALFYLISRRLHRWSGPLTWIHLPGRRDVPRA